MIGYVKVGTNDIKKAAAFYDAIFAMTGAEKVHDYEQSNC